MRESAMPNFFTFDDGLNYYPISSIDSFGVDGDGSEKGTWIKFKDGFNDGKTIHISRPAESVAEMLGSANLHY
jgi:hypothetical protein